MSLPSPLPTPGRAVHYVLANGEHRPAEARDEQGEARHLRTRFGREAVRPARVAPKPKEQG